MSEVQVPSAELVLRRHLEPERWEPRLVGFVCHWCTYAGADLAGTARRTQQPNVRLVRVLCSSRIDPLFILKTFEQGADGVLVSGCHPGDCHYVQGNLLARRRLSIALDLFRFLGLDEGRLHLAWVSASEGVKWSQIVDKVTAAVREAGPLGRWALPAGDGRAAPALEAPQPDEPRPAPTPGESADVAAALREKAAALLASGEVSVVTGYTHGSLPGQMVPAFATDPGEAAALDWNERCANNLTVYLPELLKRHRGAKVGLVAKSCDAKTLAGLVRENQVERDRVVVVGVPCRGIWENGRLAAKCFSCAEEVSPLADVTMEPVGASLGGGERPVAPDPRDAEIAALEALPAAERWEFWQRQFSRCIRCYACRAACPLCYCETCVTDKNDPQWVPVSIDGPGNLAWNVTRAMHLAGRCTGCDECTRACPADIRLDLLNRALAARVGSRFGYRPGEDVAAVPPLATFGPSDPDEFL